MDSGFDAKYGSRNHVSPKSLPKSMKTGRSNTWRNPDTINKKLAAVSSDGALGSKVNRNGGRQKMISNTEDAGDVSCQALSSNLSAQDGAQFETEQKVPEPQPQKCMTGNCVHGDRCKDLHPWFSGSGFSMLAKLEGHSKAVSGVVLPIGSDKLFSGSKDESLRVWDCHTGQCVNKITVESEIQCMLSEGPWVFAGLKNILKAWNSQTQTEYVLSGPKGVVHALAASDDVIFAGVNDGTIWAWKFNSGPCCPEFLATLKGHSLAVLSLVFGANRLYSGSKDNTIRIWDLVNLNCVETVTGHSDFVTSLLCWECYLLSGSLDNTLKVWATSQSGKLEVVHEVKNESGVIALGGIMDAENKPILLCSYKDGPVRLYDLPSFAEKGRILGKWEIETIGIGCRGLFFTGDAVGQLSVWKLDGEFKDDVS